MAIRKSTRNRWRSRHIEPAPPVPTEIVLRSRSDIGTFGEYVAGKIPAPHHEEWFPHLRTGNDSECLKEYAGENTDLLAPRGSAKSTWAAIVAADIIGHNPHVQMLYLSHSRAIALRQSRLVKRIIELPQYREVFPHIRPGSRWADTDWEIDKYWAGVNALDSDATFSAAGITGSIVGMRTHIIFGDDLIKSSAAIANENIREKIEYNFFEVVEPTLIPGGRIIDIGTLFRRDDIHHRFKEEGWNVIHTSAIVKVGQTVAITEDGRIIEVDIEKHRSGKFPTRKEEKLKVIRYEQHEVEKSYWSRYKLELLQKLREKRPQIFTFQFQNQYPPDDEEVIIKPEWIKYGAVDETKKFDRIAIGLDLAASEKETGDWTVFVVVGIKDGKYTALDFEKSRAVGNLEKLQIIKRLWEKWGMRSHDFYVVPETNAYQRSFLGDFKRIFIEEWRIDGVRIKPSPSVGDKHQRLNGVSGIFANGLIIFAESVNWRDVVAQLTFQELEHDDCADATEKALSFLQRRRSGGVW